MKRSKRPRSLTEAHDTMPSLNRVCPCIICLFLISGWETTFSVSGYNGNRFMSITKPRVTRTTMAMTGLRDSQFPEGIGFPSMMNELSKAAADLDETNGTNASTQNVISTGPGFVPTNGISEKINGYDYRNNYLQNLELEQSIKDQRDR